MKIFLLNLERALQRREIMLERLAILGLEAELLSAVDGRMLAPTDLPAGTERALSPGEIGAYLTHVNCWKTIIQRKMPYAIIIEDDVIISPGLMPVVEEIIALRIPFDAVRLSALFPIRGITVASLSGDSRLVLTTKPPGGSQAYLVSLSGARKMLSKLAVPKQPIDVAYDRYWMYGLCMPVLSPPVAEEDKSLESTIVNRIRDTYRETVIRRMLHLAEKRVRKVAAFFMARRMRKYGMISINPDRWQKKQHES